MTKKKAKSFNLIGRIKEHIQSGHYLDTRHAIKRQLERKITRPEILYVLKHGYHEKRKDQYDQKFQTWNYAIRGKTLDKKELRIIITFMEDYLLIITTINLSKKRGKNEKNKNSKDIC